MLNSEAVANYFIQKSFDKGVSLSPMKLLKLVYIAHGWHRGYFATNLINDAVQAWRYGPVIPDLYRKLKHFGRRTIDAPIEGYGIAGDSQNPVPDVRTLALLDRVWDIYSQYGGVELSAMTHQHGTPWDQIWRSSGGEDYRGAIIPNELIEQHYKQKISA
ncbi:type II toxin-antitoxin system antitoxin SocA domain-containing protein [Pseudomonas sp. Ps21-P2]|uniref:Panacea domain-containing protein n=1 Tax=Pseudomonas sp. Ps21-P2 TaxID=3080331 RepID=UPI0032088122